MESISVQRARRQRKTSPLEFDALRYLACYIYGPSNRASGSSPQPVRKNAPPGLGNSAIPSSHHQADALSSAVNSCDHLADHNKTQGRAVHYDQQRFGWNHKGHKPRKKSRHKTDRTHRLTPKPNRRRHESKPHIEVAALNIGTYEFVPAPQRHRGMVLPQRTIQAHRTSKSCIDLREPRNEMTYH